MTTPWQSDAFSFAALDGSTSLNFNGFNASLGTLIGVEIEFTISETVIDQLFNIGGHPVQDGTSAPDTASLTMTASGPLGLSSENQLTTPGFDGTNGVGLLTVGTASLTNYLVGPDAISGNDQSLASYIGGSNSVTINVTSFGAESGTLAPTVLTGYSGSSSGIVSLDYIYETPEPAALALFALGLLVLTQWRRRQG